MWHQYTIGKKVGRALSNPPFPLPEIKQMKKERKFTHKLIQPYDVLSSVSVPEKEREREKKKSG